MDPGEIMIVVLFACTAPEKTSPSEPPADVFFIGVAQDYSVGSLGSVDSVSFAVQPNLSTATGDSVLRLIDDELWMLNRYMYDTIRKYDPLAPTAPLAEVSIAPETGSANPHDIVRCGTAMLISQYGQSELLLIDPDSLDTVGAIDLSAYAHSDEIPEASSMVSIDNVAYVALQQLDRNDGFEPLTSKVISIDCATHTVVNERDIGTNIAVFSQNNRLYVHSNAAPKAIVELNAELGVESQLELPEWVSNVQDIVRVEDNWIALVARDNYSSMQLLCISDELQTSPEQIEYLLDLALINEEVWVAAHWGFIDPNAAKPGFYRFDPSTCQQLDEPVETGLAPYSVAF